MWVVVCLSAPFHCNAFRQWTFSKMNLYTEVFLRATLCSLLTLNPRKIASSVALLWPFKAPHGPPLASRGPSAPVDVFILYPSPTSRPDVRCNAADKGKKLPILTVKQGESYHLPFLDVFSNDQEQPAAWCCGNRL